MAELAENQAYLNMLIEDAQIEGDEGKLNRLLTMADELRTKGQRDLSDKGRMAGRVYIPPSPWQGLDQLVAAGRGAIKETRADKLRDKQTERRGAMRQGLLSEVLRGWKKDQPKAKSTALPAEDTTRITNWFGSDY